MTPEQTALRNRYLEAARAVGMRLPRLSREYGWWTFCFPKTGAVESRVREAGLMRMLADLEATGPGQRASA